MNLRQRMEFPVDFSTPPGEPALAAPDSVSWQIFKNPIALFVGGVSAVLLELAEPRVRSGVWDHTTFRVDPVSRMERTGLAAMLTVYGPRSKSEPMIARVRRMHDRVEGVTSAGHAYRANDPVLLDWVQATASFGFLEAYSAYVRRLSPQIKDRFYAESAPAARLYGAASAPTSLAKQQAMFDAMLPLLEPSPIIFEFLDIMARADILPAPLKSLQRILIRAGIAITPEPVRALLGLGSEWDLKAWERVMIRIAGAAADRVPLSTSPAAQSCRRMGFPANYLYVRTRG